LGWFFVFVWGEDENSAREFGIGIVERNCARRRRCREQALAREGHYKRKAGGSMPVAESDERSERNEVK